MSDFVLYTAPCPACGVPARWRAVAVLGGESRFKTGPDDYQIECPTEGCEDV